MRSRVDLDSSSIASATYDDERSVLEIAFVEGARYEYFMVPRAVFDSLISADSAGRFFTTHIRDKYQYRKL